MKLSLNWINDYVSIKDIDVKWLVSKLTMTTAEVEEVYHLEGDTVIEIDNKSLTNRPDLWCHYGMAREIAAITGRMLKDIDIIKPEELKHNSSTLDIHIEDEAKCLRYSAIKIDNIKPMVTPEIIAARLINCGLRPGNMLVDIASYVMLDMGQPLHTFDDKSIDSIRISSLKEPMQFKSLDNMDRELPKDTLMIWSKDSPLAIAGIIGGAESAVTEKTERILLESATFEGTAVRKAASAIGLRTDASARYEKFLDTALTTVAIGRFLKLLKNYQPEIAIETALCDIVINEVKPVSITIEHHDIETYLGTSIGKDTVRSILKSLQFEVEEKGEQYCIIVPTHRATKDITNKADIVEEILRLYGYDNIKGSPIKAEIVCAVKNTTLEMEHSIKDLLVKKFSFNEVHSYSWYDNNWLKKLGYSYDNTLEIANSGVTQFEKLRSELLPNLLKIIYDNRKSYEEISIFELGRVFTIEDSELRQPKHLMAAIYSSKAEEQVYRYMKGLCHCLLSNVKNIEAELIPVQCANKENCLSVSYNNTAIGYIYSIPQAVLKIFGSKHVIHVLDINLQMLSEIKRQAVRYEPISKYPDTYLDFSILTPIEQPYAAIENLLKEFTHELIIEREYVDTYIGKNIPDNMKSTTVKIIIGDKARTLQLEEINEVKELFIKHLSQKGMRLR